MERVEFSPIRAETEQSGVSSDEDPPQPFEKGWRKLSYAFSSTPSVFQEMASTFRSISTRKSEK